jgi:hypothetical protein
MVYEVVITVLFQTIEIRVFISSLRKLAYFLIKDLKHIL